MVDQISDECFDKMKAKIAAFDQLVIQEGISEDILFKLCYMSFEAILGDIDFYRIIFLDDGLPNKTKQLAHIFKEHIRGTGKDNIKNVYAEFTSSALIGVMAYWVKNHDNHSLEEISRLLTDLYTKNIISFNKV